MAIHITKNGIKVKPGKIVKVGEVKEEAHHTGKGPDVDISELFKKRNRKPRKQGEGSQKEEGENQEQSAGGKKEQSDNESEQKSEEKDNKNGDEKGDDNENGGDDKDQDGSKDQESTEDSKEEGRKEYEIGDKEYAEIISEAFMDKDGKYRIQKETAIWEFVDKRVPGNKNKKQIVYKVQNKKGKSYWVKESKITPRNLQEDLDAKKQREEERKRKEEEERQKEEEAKKEAERLFKEQQEAEARKKRLVNSKSLSTVANMKRIVNAGQRNLWLKGPAGCGKSVMCRELAVELDVEYYCISCGAGTSSTEFIGYKYPERIATPFASFYNKPSVILIDEMTALDASVAQILNASLANNEIETTTGIVRRHPECIIVATSNTFGNGADRMYVANNQLDASTIDRFVGGIIEVDYSQDYEKQYRKDVVDFVYKVRAVIKAGGLRRIASTRMIQAGIRLYKAEYSDWREMLVANWEPEERMLLRQEGLLKLD